MRLPFFRSPPSRVFLWIFGILYFSFTIYVLIRLWVGVNEIIVGSFSQTLMYVLAAVVSIMIIVYSYIIFRRACFGDTRALFTEAFIRYFPTSKSESSAALAAVFFVFFLMGCVYFFAHDLPLWWRILVFVSYTSGFVFACIFHSGKLRVPSLWVMVTVLCGTVVLLTITLFQNTVFYS